MKVEGEVLPLATTSGVLRNQKILQSKLHVGSLGGGEKGDGPSDAGEGAPGNSLAAATR